MLDDLTCRGLARPELVIVDGGTGLEAALASLWDDVPVQRCTVHKERNLLAHAPKHLHDEIKADFNDMVHAKTATDVLARRKLFLAKRKLRCRAVAESLEEAGERLFTFVCYRGVPVGTINAPMPIGCLLKRLFCTPGARTRWIPGARHRSWGRPCRTVMPSPLRERDGSPGRCREASQLLARLRNARLGGA